MKTGIFLSFILILLAACNDHKGRYTSIPPEIKAHVNWQPGSYWIMQDTTTGQIDSFYVVSYTAGIDQGNPNSNETLEILLNEVNTTGVNQDTTHWYVSIGSTGNVYNVELQGYLHNYLDFFLASSSALTDSFMHSYYSCGINYNDVYVDGPYSIPGETVTTKIQSTEGFIYIRLIYKDYNHTWCLLRQNVIHKP